MQGNRICNDTKCSKIYLNIKCSEICAKNCAKCAILPSTWFANVSADRRKLPLRCSQKFLKRALRYIMVNRDDNKHDRGQGVEDFIIKMSTAQWSIKVMLNGWCPHLLREITRASKDSFMAVVMAVWSG